MDEIENFFIIGLFLGMVFAIPMAIFGKSFLFYLDGWLIGFIFSAIKSILQELWI